ncbi:MAG: XdhC/CoxI family protein [Paracoccaceae bacterium]
MGKRVVLATVLQTWGSAPRPVGAQMAISDSMEIQGSVSGGCVESAVIEEAMASLQDGVSRILKYGVSDENAFDVGLSCGGDIQILVEPVGIGNGPDVTLLEKLTALRAARQVAIYQVDITSWARQVLTPDTTILDVSARVIADKSGFDGHVFIGIHTAPLRMIIVGAGHIAQPLTRMAALAGYDVTLIDPRAAFATSARFPGVRIVQDWPDVAMKTARLDARCAVVTLSHDPKIDDPAIIAALETDVFYLGSLGSKRTHAKRVSRLGERGLAAHNIAKIHAPVGADINAKSPAEIAISIMAEITERLRCPGTRR